MQSPVSCSWMTEMSLPGMSCLAATWVEVVIMASYFVRQFDIARPGPGQSRGIIMDSSNYLA